MSSYILSPTPLPAPAPVGIQKVYITALHCTVLYNSLKFRAALMSDEASMLLQIGLGGYVVGRSIEKIVPGIFNKNKQSAVR
jgi:hypothetical protein